MTTQEIDKIHPETMKRVAKIFFGNPDDAMEFIKKRFEACGNSEELKIQVLNSIPFEVFHGAYTSMRPRRYGDCLDDFQSMLFENFSHTPDMALQYVDKIAQTAIAPFEAGIAYEDTAHPFAQRLLENLSKQSVRSFNKEWIETAFEEVADTGIAYFDQDWVPFHITGASLMLQACSSEPKAFKKVLGWIVSELPSVMQTEYPRFEPKALLALAKNTLEPWARTTDRQMLAQKRYIAFAFANKLPDFVDYTSGHLDGREENRFDEKKYNELVKTLRFYASDDLQVARVVTDGEMLALPALWKMGGRRICDALNKMNSFSNKHGNVIGAVARHSLDQVTMVTAAYSEQFHAVEEQALKRMEKAHIKIVKALTPA